MIAAAPLVVIGQFPDIFDLPHLASEGEDVGRVTDKIERCRPVEFVDKDGEGAVVVHPQQSPGIRRRRLSGLDPGWCDSLRERVQLAVGTEPCTYNHADPGRYLMSRCEWMRIGQSQGDDLAPVRRF